MARGWCVRVSIAHSWHVANRRFYISPSVVTYCNAAPSGMRYTRLRPRPRDTACKYPHRISSRMNVELMPIMPASSKVVSGHPVNRRKSSKDLVRFAPVRSSRSDLLGPFLLNSSELFTLHPSIFVPAASITFQTVACQSALRVSLFRHALSAHGVHRDPLRRRRDGASPPVVRVYTPAAVATRNPASTSASSTALQNVCSTPQRRDACSGVSRRSGISRYSPRIRSMTRACAAQ